MIELLPTQPHDLHSKMIKEHQGLILDCKIYEKKQPEFNFIQISNTTFPAGGKNFLMSTHDPMKEVIAMKIRSQGCFECNILRSLLSALEKSTHASLIDIGGNIGMYSLHAASRGRSSVAFEPFEKNHEKFCHSILHNPGFNDKIKLVPAALINDSTIKYVEFDKRMFDTAVYRQGSGQKNFGSMTVNGRNDKPSGEIGKDFAFAITLDYLQDIGGILPEPGSHVVLKVDVEGSECKALAGALDYLSKVHIDYVALEWSCSRIEECSHEEGGTAVEKILALFAKNGLDGYKFHKRRVRWIKVDMTNPKSWCENNLFDIAFSKEQPSV